jgi:uncharacterized protein (DUF2235 family)
MVKRLVVCCDGTWNRADQHRDGVPIPTNVVRLAYRIANADSHGTPQVVCYIQGVGTGNRLDHWLGGALGAGLEEHLYEAYRFLVANYVPGDEIFLFGFSRGAFTARSLAGLVRNSGVLDRTHIHRYDRAIALYRHRALDPRSAEAVEHRAKFAIEPFTPIHFIGVWDTVGALGIPHPMFTTKYEFHDTELSSAVRHAYHALAIDEHRKPYEATLWTNHPKHRYRYPGDGVAQESTLQVLEQVWFPGAHSDIGGGYGTRHTPNLSDLTLEWMMTKAAGVGLAFAANVCAANAIPTYGNLYVAELHNSYTKAFRLFGRILRQVGSLKTNTEYLHRSVLDRIQAPITPPYAPQLDPTRLVKYLGATPRPEQTPLP